MECPNCGHQQPDELTECLKCQIIFSKWQQSQLKKRPPVINPIHSSHFAKPKKNLGMVFRIVFILTIIGIGIKYYMKLQGLPIPENAYKDAGNSFAISSLSDEWITFNSENWQAMMNKYQDRIPANIKSILTKNAAVTFIKTSSGVQSAQINIVVSKNRLPQLTERVKEKFLAELKSAFILQYPGLFQDYAVESSEIFEIDKLTSLIVTATVKMRLALTESKITQNSYGMVKFSPGSYMTSNLKFIQAFIPGSGQMYIINCMSEQGNFNEFEQVFNDTIKSFRVTKRPSLVDYLF